MKQQRVKYNRELEGKPYSQSAVWKINGAPGVALQLPANSSSSSIMSRYLNFASCFFFTKKSQSGRFSVNNELNLMGKCTNR